MDVLPAGFAAADFTARCWNAFAALLLWGVMYFGYLYVANKLAAWTSGHKRTFTSLLEQVEKGNGAAGEYLGKRNLGIAVGSGLIVAFIWGQG